MIIFRFYEHLGQFEGLGMYFGHFEEFRYLLPSKRFLGILVNLDVLVVFWTFWRFCKAFWSFSIFLNILIILRKHILVISKTLGVF